MVIISFAAVSSEGHDEITEHDDNKTPQISDVFNKIFTYTCAHVVRSNNGNFKICTEVTLFFRKVTKYRYSRSSMACPPLVWFNCSSELSICT